MTALQMAREECPNWLGEGKGCLGAIIDDDLQIRRCCPKPKCVLGTPGIRCRNFEECVAPMARTREKFVSAVQDYRRAANLPCADDRPCPVCGRAMEPKRRFCDDCVRARRRETKRLSVARSKSPKGQLSQFRPFGIKDLQG